MTRNNKPNLIVDLSFQFSLSIIQFTEELETRKKYNMANQLFRSGTSIGANINEAQNAESRKDFIHKMKKGVPVIRKAVNSQSISCFFY